MALPSPNLHRAVALLRPAPRLTLLASTRAEHVPAPHLSRLQLHLRRTHATTTSPPMATAAAATATATTVILDPSRASDRRKSPRPVPWPGARPRPASTTSSQRPSPSLPPYALYSNVRRLNSVGLTLLAVAQAGFWAISTSLSAQVAEPLISPMYTALGFGLSAAFASMIAVYLRRSVAQLHVLHGPVLRVVPHGLAGALSAPQIVAPDRIRPGPNADDPAQRYWTFGIVQPNKRVRFFIVDTKRGVLDRGAVAALARGGDHFIAWSLQRDATVMKQRWRQWKQGSADTPDGDPQSPTSNPDDAADKQRQ